MRILSEVVVLSFISFIPRGGAQTAVDHPWGDLRLSNPPGIKFSVELIEPHEYRQGELIRMSMKYPRQPLVPGQLPTQEQWQFAGFLLDPEVDCGSLQKPCMMPGGFQIDPSGLIPSIGPQSEPVVFPLNAYTPALSPGNYRAAALVRKLVLRTRTPLSASYGYANPPQYAVSNAVEFEVAPASAAWIRRTIATSAAVLKTSQPGSREAYEARRMAAQQLRFLDDPAAWEASLELLPVEEGILLRGLAATREPDRVCELMQSHISVPRQSVSSFYLHIMAQTCERAHLPRSGLMKKATADLAASLPQKQPEFKAAAFATLILYIQQLRSSEPQEAEPDWIAALSREFVRSFLGLEVPQQRYLLELYSSTFHSPELVLLLESVLDAWKPGDYYEAPRAALRALYEANQAKAQARILAELCKPKTWLDASLLDMLPPDAVPPMDDELIESLARAQRPPGWDPQLRMAALGRYATPRALARVKAIYESQQVKCQPELMAYFVRVDPAYADRVFHSHAWDMQEEPPPCTVQYFQRTPPLAMHPVLEKYMCTYLMHRDVFVKTTAARSLGLYGSKAALGPLWDAFRYFHEYWKGKGAELAKNNEGVFLDVELRNAIARGRQWLATEVDLRMIESLCISERCLYETQQDLRAWQKPLRIEISGQSDSIYGSIAQYRGMKSVTAMMAKLAQFPRGTQFLLMGQGQITEEATLEISKLAGSRGLIVKPYRP
jgi:hypothetical protein